MSPSVAAATAAVVGWAAAVVILGQAGTALAVPALAGWSLSAVLGIDAARRREAMPWLITTALVAAAGVFVGVAALGL